MLCNFSSSRRYFHMSLYLLKLISGRSVCSPMCCSAASAHSVAIQSKKHFWTYHNVISTFRMTYSKTFQRMQKILLRALYKSPPSKLKCKQCYDIYLYSGYNESNCLFGTQFTYFSFADTHFLSLSFLCVSNEGIGCRLLSALNTNGWANQVNRWKTPRNKTVQ